MELRHPPNIASVSCHKRATWKIVLIVSVFVALYAFCLQWVWSTNGEPRAWALAEQKRILRQKAQNAKETGIIVGEDTTGRKGKKNELKINEDELPSEYLPSAWCCLFIGLCLLANVVLYLLTVWSQRIRVLLLYETSETLDENSWLLIVPPQQKGKPEIAPVLEPAANANYTFDFQHIKYEILDDADVDESLVGEGEMGCKLVQSPIGCTKQYYRSARGLQTEDAIEKNTELFGANIFELPYPTFLELFQKQLQSPIVCFQLMCAFLWAMDTYWKYTMFTLMTILGFEASTAFQRLKSMSQLRNMSAKAYDVWVYRRNRWVGGVAITELLPGDIISLTPLQLTPAQVAQRTQQARDGLLERSTSATSSSSTELEKKEEAPKGGVSQSSDITVPCDCVILRGSAVVNEASLTGESVPQMKDALPPHEEGEPAFDMFSGDRIQTLYSGTTLIQATNQLEATSPSKQPKIRHAMPDEHELFTDIEAPPDGGIVCYVLRTGFSSSQGELMRMIEFSQENVAGDKKEMALQLLFLFCFAMCAAGYVLKRGLEDPERPTYKVLLRCVLILTQVVPASLPMQMAFAVHTALMNLMRKGIYCTEPFRVPEAGKVSYCFFDKTGTLTSDHMLGIGLVVPLSASAETKKLADKDEICFSEAKTARSSVKAEKDHDALTYLPPPHSDLYKQACIRKMSDHDDGAAAFVMAGCTALVEVQNKMCGDPIEIAGLKGIEWTYRSDSSSCVPGSYLAKERAIVAATQILDREQQGTAKQKELQKDVDELKQKYEQQKAHAERAKVTVLQRHHFASALQRMSTICQVECKKEAHLLGSGSYAFVKGSPEAIMALLDQKLYGNDDFRNNYFAIYKSLAEQGQRVLALAYKKLPNVDANKRQSFEKLGRSDVESSLRFAGFASYKCETRKDSRLVIGALEQSAHTCIMVTGDAALTAYSVAKETGIAAKPGKKALILADDGSHWKPAITKSIMPAETTCSGAAQFQELFDDDHDLVITGKALDAALERFGDEIWNVLKYICVFARLSPQQKEDIIRAVGGHHFEDVQEAKLDKSLVKHTLMCGDGGNDVGALKQADVGVALLSGFGNSNVDVKQKKEKAPTDFFANLFGGGGEGEEEEEEGPEPGSIEDQLAKLKEEEAQKLADVQKKMKEDFTKKQSGMYVKQQEYVEKEMTRRRESGLDTGFAAHMQVMKDVMARLKQEIEDERASLQKQHGSAFSTGHEKWTEGLENVDETPAIKLGDASIAAPFTSRTPSINAVVDVIRQGRCTLLSAVQQMQIMMLDSMISAYALAMMSADGTRPSEQQMMASGTFMSIAHISFSFARPLDRLHRVRPLRSVFHLALFVSLIGQVLIHLGVMVYITNLAKDTMGEEALAEVLKFEKERHEHIDFMEEDAFDDVWWFTKVPFKPNLLNTMVWLVEVSQQISVLFVNYKGRPWMKGMLENQPLFLSLFACLGMVWLCATNVVPMLTEALKLEPVPVEVRGTMMLCLLASLVGAFVWDRFCHWMFAPEIFAVMMENVRTTTLKDWFPILKTLGYAGGGCLVLSTGNILTIGGMFYFWRQWKNQQTAAAEAAKAAAAGGSVAADGAAGSTSSAAGASRKALAGSGAAGGLKKRK